MRRKGEREGGRKIVEGGELGRKGKSEKGKEEIFRLELHHR